MDIACPRCGATYRVPDALIDGASALRCAACGDAWVPALPPVEIAPEVPPAGDPVPPSAEAAPPAVEPPREPPREPLGESPAEAVAEEAPPQPRHEPPHLDTTLSLPATRATPPDLKPRRQRDVPRGRRSGSALSAAWAVSLVLVGLLVLGFVIYHAQIAEAWPPFARLAG
ncbi:zinc-ribbon domain-containing protein [Roseococcus sp.]|uniref:zinc-ribbon domain-containing protein n=1 Tax=Roseococcus sp. TaxID=2109646 RepID=UPI003BA99E90